MIITVMFCSQATSHKNNCTNRVDVDALSYLPSILIGHSHMECVSEEVSSALSESKSDQWHLRHLSFDLHTSLFSVALRRAEEGGVEPAW